MTQTTFTVSDLRDKLVLLDARITKAEVALRRATREVEELREQRRGAEAFIALLEQPERPAGNATGITAVVHDIMAEHPEGISHDDIAKVASGRGHDLDGEQVRSSVTYLRRRGEAEQVTRGVWRLIDTGYPAEHNVPTSLRGPADTEPLEENPTPLTPVSVVG